MNLINRKMQIFCISNIMVSFVCGNFIGNAYHADLIRNEEKEQDVVASSDTDPLSHLGEENNKTIDEVIDVPTVEELNETKSKAKVVKTSTKTTTTNVVTKKEVQKSTTYVPAKYDEVTGSLVVDYAKKYLGLRYNGGLSLTTGTDCSGFTKLIYQEFGITLSRNAKGQAKSGTYVRKSDLQKGDLVFYSNGSGKITHVGIYIGSGQVIHESNPRDGVKISSVNMMQYITARRVINSNTIKLVEEKTNLEKENDLLAENQEIVEEENNNVISSQIVTEEQNISDIINDEISNDKENNIEELNNINEEIKDEKLEDEKDSEIVPSNDIDDSNNTIDNKEENVIIDNKELVKKSEEVMDSQESQENNVIE